MNRLVRQQQNTHTYINIHAHTHFPPLTATLRANYSSNVFRLCREILGTGAALAVAGPGLKHKHHTRTHAYIQTPTRIFYA